MARDDVEYLFAILDAASGGQRLTEHGFRIGIVHVDDEREFTGDANRRARAARSQAPRGPSRERASNCNHIVLCISAIDAEGVELEQLASVVLVDATAFAEMVVEVKEHRRAMSDGASEVAEPAQCARPDHVALI